MFLEKNPIIKPIKVVHITYFDSAAGAVEKGEDKVIVTCLVDDLQVSGLVNKTVKNGSVSVTFGDRYIKTWYF